MKPGSQKSRDAFEQYLKRNGASLRVDEEGFYTHVVTAIAWDTWKAAVQFVLTETAKGNTELVSKTPPTSAPNN